MLVLVIVLGVVLLVALILGTKYIRELCDDVDHLRADVDMVAQSHVSLAETVGQTRGMATNLDLRVEHMKLELDKVDIATKTASDAAAVTAKLRADLDQYTDDLAAVVSERHRLAEQQDRLLTHIVEHGARIAAVESRTDG